MPQQRHHHALHAALTPLHAAFTPPSRHPHAAARSCSLAPRPPPSFFPPLCLRACPHTTTTPPPRSPHAAARRPHAALTPPLTSCTQPSRRPRATHPQAHPAAANDFLGWALALEGQGGDGVEGLVGLGWRVKQHSIGKSCQGEKWGRGG